MKAHIFKDSYYPFYGIDPYGIDPTKDVEIPVELYEKYRIIIKGLEEIQEELRIYCEG